MASKMAAIQQYGGQLLFLVVRGIMTQETSATTGSEPAMFGSEDTDANRYTMGTTIGPTPPVYNTTTSTTTRVTGAIISTANFTTVIESHGHAGKSLTSGAIAGIVLAVLILAGVVLILAGLVIYRKWHKRKQRKYIESMNPVSYRDSEGARFETSVMDNSSVPNPVPDISRAVYGNVEGENEPLRPPPYRNTTSKTVEIGLSGNKASGDDIDLVYDVPNPEAEAVVTQPPPHSESTDVDVGGVYDVPKRRVEDANSPSPLAELGVHKEVNVEDTVYENNTEDVDLVYDVPKPIAEVVVAQPPVSVSDADASDGEAVAVEGIAANTPSPLAAKNTHNEVEDDDVVYEVPRKLTKQDNNANIDQTGDYNEIANVIVNRNDGDDKPIYDVPPDRTQPVTRTSQDSAIIYENV